ncbi:MAG: 2Fe-2S iron-sulfur cluster-binding protein [Verrucomicrobiota bacterium]
MVSIQQTIRFILNDKEILANVVPGMLALDYLRKERRLTGTKEGCKEGDCGACTVIVGELLEQRSMSYKPETACLLPMGELHGKHLVTVEGLAVNGGLSPVQAAMVDAGGTQCGYCTPGFVVAMTAGLMEPRLPLDREGLLYAISGNLCRCTGYRSIKEAGLKVMDELSSQILGRERITALCDARALPEYFINISERLAAIEPITAPETFADERALFMGGGTDLYVQRGEDIPEEPVLFLNNRLPVPAARLEGNRVVVDARMTFEDFANDPLIQKQITDIYDYNLLIASWPVRTRSTLGGNICNASPIADMTCLLLALDVELTLSKNGVERSLPLKEFYLGYKQLSKAPDEMVKLISFPVLSNNCLTNWEKVSKRAWLDIATVNSAIKLTVVDGVITDAHLALGGVAATPLYLEKSSAFLLGKPISEAVVIELVIIALSEFQPISDVRGSAKYKKLLARQLILAHFDKLFSGTVELEEIYAAL